MSEAVTKFFRSGLLTTIPKSRENKEHVFEYLTTELQKQGERFTERDLNEFLVNYYPDFAILRRYLVDFGFLDRDKYGKYYTIIRERLNHEK